MASPSSNAPASASPPWWRGQGRCRRSASGLAWRWWTVRCDRRRLVGGQLGVTPLDRHGEAQILPGHVPQERGEIPPVARRRQAQVGAGGPVRELAAVRERVGVQGAQL